MAFVFSSSRRRQKRSLRNLTLGTVLTAAFVAVPLIGTTTSSTGCASQETTQAPDANRPPCNRGPFIFCQPAAAGDPQSCDTDQGSSVLLTRLPRATKYPVGCVIDFVGDRDEQGDCKLEAVCKCVIGEIPPQTPEGGTPVVEAGVTDDAGDAGDAGDASAPPPPPPPPGPIVQGPVWNCYP